MPELPEVEVVTRGLTKVLAEGATIHKIQYRRKDIRNVLPVKFKHLILNRRIVRIYRRAKYILLETEDATLISHLGMTGTWRVVDGKEKLEVHDHVVLHLSDGRRMVYNDPRRFGVFDIIKGVLLTADKRFASLGPEPLGTEFTAEYLKAKAAGKIAPVKSFIMDQRVVVGVGNIYACEALFLAGISPLTPAGELKPNQLRKLVHYIREVLTAAIAAGGSSISDYHNIEERAGEFQDNFRVYGRKGASCHKCSRPIRVEVISGRSTFWCVHCQKGSQGYHERAKKNHSGKNSSKTSRTQRSRRKHS